MKTKSSMIVMDTPNNKSIPLSPKLTEEIMEEQRIHDVLLLLENLSYREETTVKLIIDCLYDVGATNLINQKFNSYAINGTVKKVARFSKPVFRMIAWRWFKKNCPQLITNWLHDQVRFKKAIPTQPEIVVEQVPIQQDLPIILEDKNREVKYLRSQVRLLIAIFILAVTSFSGSFLWLNYRFEQANLQTLEQLQTQLKIKEASVNNP
ncbi:MULTISPECIES: hypothetical protein [unclassified Anabaena]|uniref:hypothetical protein n=1 Tax=unclassified Anabaena TaxID=2619674 RepID=UPI000835A921|nr:MULTISPECIES: hypothetical protein [unclassified Anabaena]